MRDVPGRLIRSVCPDRTGQPVYNAGTFTTDLESPISDHRGGCYVVGTHGKQRHMGNVSATDFGRPKRLNTDAGANLAELFVLIKTYILILLFTRSFGSGRPWFCPRLGVAMIFVRVRVKILPGTATGVLRLRPITARGGRA